MKASKNINEIVLAVEGARGPPGRRVKKLAEIAPGLKLGLFGIINS